MPHIKTINRDTYWDHTYFSGRRVNKPDGTPDGDKSWWSIVYAEYDSEQAAINGKRPIRKAGSLKIKGSLLDSLFLNSKSTGYEMTDAKVFGALKKLLSESLTKAELDDTENVEQVRSAMLGVPMFGGAFTVSELEMVDE